MSGGAPIPIKMGARMTRMLPNADPRRFFLLRHVLRFRVCARSPGAEAPGYETTPGEPGFRAGDPGQSPVYGASFLARRFTCG